MKEAEEIIEKFFPYANDDYYNDKENAKQCALIYCDGKIELIEEMIKIYGVGTPILEKYQQLKQAINNG